MSSPATLPTTQAEWKKALAALPAVPPGGKIPAFFFAHGSPMLIAPPGPGRLPEGIMKYGGPNGPQAAFLRDFGPALLEKYAPKGIVVFSAHWETKGEMQVTEYGDENPLLMDYYGFDSAYYDVKFKSRGDGALSQRVVDAFKQHGLSARTTTKLEARGEDGRGFQGPGFDHGVFVPFKLMFGDEFTAVPIVEASLDASLSPQANWRVGEAMDILRSEGILVLAGGLTVHTFRDFSAFSAETAKPAFKEWDRAVLAAAGTAEPERRRTALMELVEHRGFRAAHPREEHFVPVYVAAGAGAKGGSSVLSGLYGAMTVAFGLE